jgi:hypothetical protein
VRRVHDLALRAKREALASLTEALDAAVHAQASDERVSWEPTYAAVSDEYSKEVQKTGGDSRTRARLVARRRRLSVLGHSRARRAKDTACRASDERSAAISGAPDRRRPKAGVTYLFRRVSRASGSGSVPDF